jgi:hypothetical protein
MFYIVDEKGQRTRDSRDEEFLCADMDEVEDVISFYFDMQYGDCFRVHNTIGEHVDTFIAEYED